MLFRHARISSTSSTTPISAPTSYRTSPLFGQSTQMLGASLGSGGQNGLNPLYQIGGARSVQLALRLQFYWDGPPGLSKERPSRPPFSVCQDASASNTAARFLAITARYARVVASGFLRPCSHSCKVRGLMQNARANSAWDIPAMVRIRLTSTLSGSTIRRVGSFVSLSRAPEFPWRCTPASCRTSSASRLLRSYCVLPSRSSPFCRFLDLGREFRRHVPEIARVIRGSSPCPRGCPISKAVASAASANGQQLSGRPPLCI